MRTTGRDSMTAYLRDLDKRVSRQGRRSGNSSGLAGLRAEVAELRDEVASLRAEIEMLRPEGRNGKTTKG